MTFVDFHFELASVMRLYLIAACDTMSLFGDFSYMCRFTLCVPWMILMVSSTRLLCKVGCAVHD